MSEDEVFVLIVGGVIGLVAWVSWYWQTLRPPPLGPRTQARRWLWLVPPVCAVLLFGVLRSFAAEDVRHSPIYLFFYMVMGSAWVGIAKAQFAFLGMSARDDVIERGNLAAACGISGGLIGLTFCFAGGNIGDGPGWWVVVFAAALATVAFGVLWGLLAKLTDLADAVTIDRDPAAGLRTAGFLAGAGLVLGRAVAGNWVSTGTTLADFGARGWPVLLLLATAAAIERLLRELAGREGAGWLAAGLAPGLLYVVLGGVIVAWAGPW
jgi:uncharacterized membrane protein YjfL (UPF0719 family)